MSSPIIPSRVQHSEPPPPPAFGDAPPPTEAQAPEPGNDASTGHGETAEPEIIIDQAKVEGLMREMRADQNLLFGMMGGMAGCVVGASLWAAITATTMFQIGWMAVGVGFLAGLGVRKFGKGVDPIFGWLGAGFALMGCLLGNLLTGAAVYSSQEGVNMAIVVLGMMISPMASLDVLVAMFSPMDILFYGLAIYEGYRFSFRVIGEEELARLQA